MNVKILGTGCLNCQKLEANAKQALKELGIEVQVEKVTDIQEIASYGIMSLPAIVADDKIISHGLVPTAEEIKELLTNKKTSSDSSSKNCSCGSGCC